MKLDKLKQYMDENKTIQVTDELKQKTLEAVNNEMLLQQAMSTMKKEQNKKKLWFKWAGLAASLLLVIGMGVSVLFLNLFSNEKGKQDQNYMPSDGSDGSDGNATDNDEMNGIGDVNEGGPRYSTPLEEENSGYMNDGNVMDSNNHQVTENPFIKTSDEKVSTFSIDVDTASYVLFRRTVSQLSLEKLQQYKNYIRTEEAINYFRYNYEEPAGHDPMAVTTWVGDCAWNNKAKLAMITLAGKKLEASAQAGSNIVFLIDISGSMGSEDKLPLLKRSLAIAVENLNPKDKVSIITYASGVNRVLSGVSGNQKNTILSALNQLESGGSTAGASGLNVAYSVAEDYMIANGNNRIILATDGDFNVGPSSVEEMKKLVTNQREKGIFLTVLGFGVNFSWGDKRLEVLADNGNGGYYIIDNADEANKILNEQFTGTLYTIAKDVKLQVEFNENAVESYRLIGYENRTLANEDFENDSVDAGDLGAGQTVTAVYELILKKNAKEELFSVKVRYKEPNSQQSQLYEHGAKISTDLTDDFYFVSAVVETCLVINNSEYKGSATIQHAYTLAERYGKQDKYKIEFANILALWIQS